MFWGNSQEVQQKLQGCFWVYILHSCWGACAVQPGLITGANVCCNNAAFAAVSPHCGGEPGHRGSSSSWQGLTGVFFHGITHAYVRTKLLWRRLGEAVMNFWIEKCTMEVLSPAGSGATLGLQHLGHLSFGSALCSRGPHSFKR